MYINMYIAMETRKKMNAITISPTELRANQKKYFDMAENTRVFVKRGRKLIELVVKDSIDMNPSPSGDAWFDDPRNVEEVMKRIKEYESGESELFALEDVQKEWQNISY